MAAAEYTVVRDITIDAAPAAVFTHLDDFHKWEAWSPWADIDPDMSVTYSGPDQGVGALYEWSGNKKAGAGSMKLSGASQDESVTIDLAFLKPMKSQATVVISLAAAGEGTHATWTMTGPNTVMTRIMGIFKSMDSLVGPDFEKGLSQLKTVTESA